MKNLKPKVAAAMVALIFIALFTYSAFARADEQTKQFWEDSAAVCLGSLGIISQRYEGEQAKLAERDASLWYRTVRRHSPGIENTLARRGFRVIAARLDDGEMTEADLMEIGRECSIAIWDYMP